MFSYIEQNTLSVVVEFLWTTSVMVKFQDSQQDSWEKLTLKTANALKTHNIAISEGAQWIPEFQGQPSENVVVMLDIGELSQAAA